MVRRLEKPSEVPPLNAVSLHCHGCDSDDTVAIVMFAHDADGNLWLYAGCTKCEEEDWVCYSIMDVMHAINKAQELQGSPRLYRGMDNGYL